MRPRHPFPHNDTERAAKKLLASRIWLGSGRTFLCMLRCPVNPGRQLLDERAHDSFCGFEPHTETPFIGARARIAHEISHATQDQAGYLVACSHPGDGTRFPVSGYRLE